VSPVSDSLLPRSFDSVSTFVPLCMPTAVWFLWLCILVTYQWRWSSKVWEHWLYMKYYSRGRGSFQSTERNVKSFVTNHCDCETSCFCRCFIDFEKAFSEVSRNKLWQLCTSLGCSMTGRYVLHWSLELEQEVRGNIEAFEMQC